MLNPAAEVLLSYLTGLAPAGEPIEPHLSWLMADLEYSQKVSIYRALGQLIRAGCVQKVAGGSNGTVGVLVVTKRLEDIARRPPPKHEACLFPAEDKEDEIGSRGWGVDRVSTEDRLARFAEIPKDTRDLTARVFGDPIPGDQRRRRRDAVPGVSLWKPPAASVHVIPRKVVA